MVLPKVRSSVRALPLGSYVQSTETPEETARDTVLRDPVTGKF